MLRVVLTLTIGGGSLTLFGFTKLADGETGLGALAVLGGVVVLSSVTWPWLTATLLNRGRYRGRHESS